MPKKGFLRNGRLKQLSSIHRFYGDDPSREHRSIRLLGRKRNLSLNLFVAEGLLNLCVNRRVSVYLLKRDGIPFFIYFREDCEHIMSVQLNPDPSYHFRCDPHKLLYDVLQQTQAMETDTFERLAEDPFRLVAMIETQLMLTWHHLATRLQNDLETLVSFSRLPCKPLCR